MPCCSLAAAFPLAGREKSKLSYGEGLIVNVPLPASEVEQVVEDVAQNGVIRGTKEYNKDEFVSGAKAATSSHVFPAWTEGGKVFYKVREQALDPRNFKDSSDSGTLVVRYVVQAQGEKNTVLRINALFKEDFRHIVHQSDGSVETAEYNDIREHVEAIELMKKQNVEAEQERQERSGEEAKSAGERRRIGWGCVSDGFRRGLPAPRVSKSCHSVAPEQLAPSRSVSTLPQSALNPSGSGRGSAGPSSRRAAAGASQSSQGHDRAGPGRSRQGSSQAA